MFSACLATTHSTIWLVRKCKWRSSPDSNREPVAYKYATALPILELLGPWERVGEVAEEHPPGGKKETKRRYDSNISPRL